MLLIVDQIDMGGGNNCRIKDAVMNGRIGIMHDSISGGNEPSDECCGIVMSRAPGLYDVKTPDGMVRCSISSTLRKVLVYPLADPSSRRPTVDRVDDIRMVDPVAVNDTVEFINNGDGTGMITGIQPRRNRFSRLAAGPKPIEQVIVANADRIVMVFAATKPKPKWSLLDRYIADSEAADIPAMICITKMDLDRKGKVRDDLSMYEEIGYPVIYTSSEDGTGIDEMRDALKDRVSVFIGKSGVGKTTLLNAVQPGLGLRVNDVSEVTGKGKHTTTSLDMFELDSGGFVVDTPGMREFGLYKTGDLNIAWLFREMRPYIGKCRFGLDCTHSHEPDCAIKDAVDEGLIYSSRYESYLKLSK